MMCCACYPSTLVIGLVLTVNAIKKFTTLVFTFKKMEIKCILVAFPSNVRPDIKELSLLCYAFQPIKLKLEKANKSVLISNFLWPIS
jgi:hypothetical protein